MYKIIKEINLENCFDKITIESIDRKNKENYALAFDISLAKNMEHLNTSLEYLMNTFFLKHTDKELENIYIKIEMKKNPSIIAEERNEI